MGNGLSALANALSGFGLTWLVQSSVLLVAANRRSFALAFYLF